MALYVISDLHIRSNQDPMYRSLLKLIQTEVVSGDTFVLAGDIFDLFVGNKSVFRDRYQEFLQTAMKAAQKGVRFHYIEGNHDFHVQEVFQSIPNWQTHAEGVWVEGDQKKFYISHGDLADRSDWKYLALRLFFRSQVVKTLLGLCPGEKLDQFGNWCSRRSGLARKSLSSEPQQWSPERLEVFRKKYRDHALTWVKKGADVVVMGHCHDLDQHTGTHLEKPYEYWNVGYPPVHQTYLYWKDGQGPGERKKMD